MSDKMPYYKIDKVATTVSLDAKVRVKWENRASAAGKPVTKFIAKFLEEEVDEDPFTLEDVERADKYMRENAEKREIRKAKKGVK